MTTKKDQRNYGEEDNDTIEDLLPWEKLESVNFIPNIIYSSRHNVPIDVVVYRLRKSIKNGNLIHACFWAAEMDMSGWGELLWDELFDVCFSDIGLVAPSSSTHLRKYYKSWKRYVQQYPKKPSWDNIFACRIIITIVRYLCGTWKNRTVAHATIWSITKAQPGLLSTEEWNTSLGMGDYVKEKLKLIHQGHTPSMRKRIDNLLLALVRNNELTCIRHSDYMVISGNTKVVWQLIGLCIEYTHQNVTKEYYTWYIPYYKDFMRICKRYNRNCPQDKYLKGGHLEIDGSLYPRNRGVFKFEDGTYSYPYMDHPHSKEYQKYSHYIPYGQGFRPTNARRMNYNRRCVVQAVTLMCRGQPNGADERTPLDYTCEDFFAQEMYSPRYPLPQNSPEENLRGIPSDWTTRESMNYSTCDARHWWATADSVAQLMEIPNRYSDAAFDATLEQEIYFGRRASEEFSLYRYIHSLAHYEGIVQNKPEMWSKPSFDTSHLFLEDGKSEDEEEEESSMDDTEFILLPSEELANQRMEKRKKKTEMLQSDGGLTDLISEMRGRKRSHLAKSDCEIIRDMTLPIGNMVIVDEIKAVTTLCRNIHRIFMGIQKVAFLLTQILSCYKTRISISVKEKLLDKREVVYKTQAYTNDDSSEIQCCFALMKDTGKPVPIIQYIASVGQVKLPDDILQDSFLSILGHLDSVKENGFHKTNSEDFEKSILTEVILSLILGNGGNYFPLPIEDFMERFPGMYCQESYCVVVEASNYLQCFWNYPRQLSSGFISAKETKRCSCSREHKDIWIKFLKELYCRHHKYLVESFVLWNTIVREDNMGIFSNIYKLPSPMDKEDNMCKRFGVPSSHMIESRIKKCYSSIMGNRLFPMSSSNQSPSALDIIFCS